METNRQTGVALLLFGGLSLSLLVAWLPPKSFRTVGQAEVASLAVAIGAGTLLATGGAWLLGDAVSTALRTRLPAVGLALSGVAVIAGTALVFATRTPSEPSGLFTAAGVLVVTGMGAVLLQGLRWARTESTGLPLALLIGVVNIGLFHRFAQQYDPRLPVVVTGIVVLLLGLGPVVAHRVRRPLAVCAN